MGSNPIGVALIMKITILNKKWSVRAYRLKTYQKHCGHDSVALCETDLKRITFILDGLTLETVIHELVHAYTSEMAFVELDLDDDQTEEFFSELFSRHGQLMLMQAKEIFEAMSR